MDNNVISDIVKAIKASDPRITPYDTTAEVVRVEDNTAWVHIPGGVEETPVNMSVAVRAGDTVRVRVANGQAWLTGNDTAPPTDDKEAINARTKAEEAQGVAVRSYSMAEQALDDAEVAHEAAITAQGYADAAQASATNANEYASRALGGLSTVQSVAETLTWITQHGTMTNTQSLTPPETALDPTHVYFVRDNNGDYQVGSYRYSIVTEPDVADIANYYVLSVDESLNNYVGTHLALTNDGLWLLPAGTGSYKVLIATGATGSAYTAGTYIIDNTGGTVAYFGATGLEVVHGLTEIAHLGYGSGNNSSGTTSNAPYYTFGERKTGNQVGNYSVAEGYQPIASGFASHAEGYETTAEGSNSHAEGESTSATGVSSHAEGHAVAGGSIIASGLGAHAEGEAQDDYSITASGSGAHAEGSAQYGNKLASGTGAHAEGESTTASNNFAHAEGARTTASGVSSHAEGSNTTASNASSHAEGYETVASGEYSHAQNRGTIAKSYAQTAIGQYNQEDSNNKYALIIGNGTILDRSNAFTVDWDGKIGGAMPPLQYFVWDNQTFKSDCDSAMITGWSIISAARVGAGVSNFPPTTHGGYWLSFYMSDDFVNQFFFPRETGDSDFFWRKKANGNWGSWFYVGQGVRNVAYDSSNKKITKTIGGTTSDIVTLATIASAMGGLTSKGSLSNFNSASTTGWYTYTSSATGRPPVNAGGSALIIAYSTTYRYEIALCNSTSDTATPYFYIRRSYGTGDSDWADWKKVAFS